MPGCSCSALLMVFLLRLSSASGVVPYCCAMEFRLSPATTVCFLPLQRGRDGWGGAGQVEGGINQ